VRRTQLGPGAIRVVLP